MMSDPKAPAETQAEKFKRLAREIGADEDEAAFKERLKRLAKAEPKSGKAKGGKKEDGE